MIINGEIFVRNLLDDAELGLDSRDLLVNKYFQNNFATTKLSMKCLM